MLCRKIWNSNNTNICFAEQYINTLTFKKLSEHLILLHRTVYLMIIYVFVTFKSQSINNYIHYNESGQQIIQFISAEAHTSVSLAMALVNVLPH